MPIGVRYGIAPGSSRFFSRSAAGSMPSSAAATSITRSMCTFASGRPAPRYASVVMVLVNATRER